MEQPVREILRKLGLACAGVVVLVVAAGCENIANDIGQLDFRGAIREITDRCEFGPPANPVIQQIRRDHYRSWPKPMRDAVDEHRVIVGMDKLQVQLATRIDESLIDKQTDAAGETWILWKARSPDYNNWSFALMGGWQQVKVRFREGKVVELVRE